MPPMAQVNYAPFRRTKKWPAIFREPNDDKQRLFLKNGKLFLDGALRWAYVGGRTGKNGVEVLQSMNSPNSNALTGRKDRVHCSGGGSLQSGRKDNQKAPSRFTLWLPQGLALSGNGDVKRIQNNDNATRTLLKCHATSNTPTFQCISHTILTFEQIWNMTHVHDWDAKNCCETTLQNTPQPNFALIMNLKSLCSNFWIFVRNHGKNIQLEKLRSSRSSYIDAATMCQNHNAPALCPIVIVGLHKTS